VNRWTWNGSRLYAAVGRHAFHSVLSYSQLAPLLAERVLKIQQDIEDSLYAARALGESQAEDIQASIALRPDTLTTRFS